MKKFTSLTIPILASILFTSCSLFSKQNAMNTQPIIIPENAKAATFA